MTEPKKVAFSTLGSMKKEKKREKMVKSLRIALTLAESNEKSCPEFNYRELLTRRLHERIGKKSLGDVINGPSLDPSDPFCTDEDAALKALAKKFETKYGTTTPNRKKKRRKENDFSTLGEGYDETDPFIDNSDAFDEVMPTHLETKHRGFYINSGELDFETVPEASSEEEETASSETDVRKRRPNQVVSDDEDKNEEGEEEKEKVEEGEEDDEEVQVKKRKLCENGFIRHKKRKLDEGELLRRRKKMIGQFNAKNQEKKDSDQEVEKPINGSETKAAVEIAPNEENIKASIEAVVIKARQEAVEQKEESEESQSSSSNSSSSDSDSSGSSSSSGSDSEEEGGQQEDEAPVDQENEEGNEEKEEEGGEEIDAPSASNDAHPASDTEDNNPLPENLPHDLTLVISRLKEQGQTCKGSSQKFFTDDVNKLLLSIEIKLNKLGGRKKTQIYSHLSQHLPCGTQTIVKRAKNLLTERQDTRLQEPLKRLKEAVEAAMPPLIERHALECQKAAESKGENGVPPNEDEENNEGDKKKASRLPKKRFMFSDEIRKHLIDVVQVRVCFWQMIRKRSETPEEYIRLFLDTEVRPIWPKGWINTRILYKESQEAHSAITDKSYSRSVSVKKPVSLGGGTVITNSPQPPKPSLSATVLPKSSPTPSASSTPTKPKGEPSKRKSISVDHREAAATPGKQQSEDRLSASSGVLSIRSVEKINEGAPRKGEEGDQVEKQERLGSEESSGRDKPQSDKKAATAAAAAASSGVSIIDLSSDEEKTLLNKASSLSGGKSVSVVNAVKDSKMNDEVFAMPSPGSVASMTTNADSLPLDLKKEDNLEEEMNLVMNEILQISKKKSADDSMERATKDSKDIAPSPAQSASASVSIKQQLQHHHSSSQSQETYHHHHHHHHHHHSHHPKHDSHSSSTSTKQERSSQSPGKQSSSASPAKHHHSHHPKQESQSFISSTKQEVSSVSPGKQSSSGSPVKQAQLSVKTPLISPVKQEQSLSSLAKQHSTQQQQQQHAQSEVTHTHSHERHSSKSSSADHSKHSLTSHDKHSSEHNSHMPSHKQASQRQIYPDPHHKPSKHHSSKQERQSHSSHSLPLVEPKSPVQSQHQHALSSLQHHSPSQHTTKQSQQQQQHSLQQSQHSQRQQQQQQQQQPLNLQQPKQQQHALNLQQPKVQHASSSYHHSSSGSQYPLSQPHSPSPEPSRQKKQQSHYSQSHHQSQSNSKPSIASSWSSSSELAMISKTSPTSTSKTHSTWASSHDVPSSRQRQSDVPIVTSSDPLANLRMMHGLSVSSVTKKTSSSTSVYHSPAALATSSIGPYNTSGSGSKKSSSSSSTSTTSAKASTSLPSHGSSSIGLHSSNKTSAHNYSSSQSKHSSPSLAYSSSSQHSTAAKARLDPYVASMSQSLYGGMTADQQLSAYKQLQQHQQTNHLTPHQQQELWQQMSSSGFLPGMGSMSSTDMLKLMSQMGKPMDSYNSASQHGQKRPGQRHSQF